MLCAWALAWKLEAFISGYLREDFQRHLLSKVKGNDGLDLLVCSSASFPRLFWLPFQDSKALSILPSNESSLESLGVFLKEAVPVVTCSVQAHLSLWHSSKADVVEMKCVIAVTLMRWSQSLLQPTFPQVTRLSMKPCGFPSRFISI